MTTPQPQSECPFAASCGLHGSSWCIKSGNCNFRYTRETAEQAAATGLRVEKKLDAHLETWEGLNGSLRSIAEFAQGVQGIILFCRRWIRPPIIILGAAIGFSGGISVAIIAIITLLRMI